MRPEHVRVMMTGDTPRRGERGDGDRTVETDREHEAVRDRASEAEPKAGDVDGQLGTLDEVLEALSYPTTTDELVAAHGDHEVQTRGGMEPLEAVLAPTAAQTYDSADDVRRRILGLVGR